MMTMTSNGELSDQMHKCTLSNTTTNNTDQLYQQYKRHLNNNTEIDNPATATILSQQIHDQDNDDQYNDDYAMCQIANMKMIARVAPVACSVIEQQQQQQQHHYQQQDMVEDLQPQYNDYYYCNDLSSTSSTSILSSSVASDRQYMSSHQHHTRRKHNSHIPTSRSRNNSSKNCAIVSSLPHHYRRQRDRRSRHSPTDEWQFKINCQNQDQSFSTHANYASNRNIDNSCYSDQNNMLLQQHQSPPSSHWYPGKNWVPQSSYQYLIDHPDTDQSGGSSSNNTKTHNKIHLNQSNLGGLEKYHWHEQQQQQQQQQIVNDSHHHLYLGKNDEKYDEKKEQQLEALCKHWPIGELRLVAKLVNGGAIRSFRSHCYCKCRSCQRQLTTTTTTTTAENNKTTINDNNYNYLNVSPDGQYLHIENPFEITKQHHRSHHGQQCNKFKFETIIDCRQRPTTTTTTTVSLAAPAAANHQNSKFDLIIKSLIKSFINHGNDACILSIGDDPVQTQSTLLGTTMSNTTANQLSNAGDDLIEAIVPKSIIYCYQLIDKLKAANNSNPTTTSTTSYHMSLKCILVMMSDDRQKPYQGDIVNESPDGQTRSPHCYCIYDLLLPDLDIIRKNALDSSSDRSQHHLALANGDSLYRDIESKQVEKHCDQMEDFMQTIQLVLSRYNQLCQMHTPNTTTASLPNLIMKVNLTRKVKSRTSSNNNNLETTKSKEKKNKQMRRPKSHSPEEEVFTSSSNFCLLDLHPTITTTTATKSGKSQSVGFSHHLISMLCNKGSIQRAAAATTTGLDQQQILLYSILRAHLNGALMKSLVLVHLNDCEMAYNNNVEMARFAFLMQQASMLRIQRRNHFIKLIKQTTTPPSSTREDSNNNNDETTDSTSRIDVVVDHQSWSSRLTSSHSSSIDTVIQSKRIQQARQHLADKVDLNALLLSPRRLPFRNQLSGNSGHQQVLNRKHNPVSSGRRTTTRFYGNTVEQQVDNRSDTISSDNHSQHQHQQQIQANTKLYMIDCPLPEHQKKPIDNNHHKLVTATTAIGRSLNNLDYYTDGNESSPRAESPPFPSPPLDNSDHCNNDGDTTMARQQQHLSDDKGDIYSQSDMMSDDLVAEPPKQLKLEQFLQQLTTIITPLKHQSSGSLNKDLQQSLDLPPHVDQHLEEQDNSNTMGSTTSLSLIPPPPIYSASNDDDDCCSHSSIMNHLSLITNNNIDIIDSHIVEGENYHHHQDTADCKEQLYSKVNKPPLASPSSGDDDHQSNKASSTSSGCSSSANYNTTKNRLLLANETANTNPNDDQAIADPLKLLDTQRVREPKTHKRQRSTSTRIVMQQQQQQPQQDQQQIDLHHQQQTSSGYTSSCNTSIINCNSTGDLQQIISATRLYNHSTSSSNIIRQQQQQQQQQINNRKSSAEPGADGGRNNINKSFKEDDNSQQNTKEGDTAKQLRHCSDSRANNNSLSPDQGIISSASSGGERSDNDDIDTNYGSIKKSTCSLLCCRFPSILVGPSKQSSKN